MAAFMRGRVRYRDSLDRQAPDAQRQSRLGEPAEVVNKRALVRRPGPRLADGLLTHIERRPSTRARDPPVARIRRRAPGRGLGALRGAPADDCPDAVFVEDTVVVYGDLAVIARPGADERKPETAGTEEALRGLGYRIAHIEEPGTLDGGDVLKHGGTVWVGLGGRTNQAGLDQLAAHLAPLGATWSAYRSPRCCT